MLDSRKAEAHWDVAEDSHHPLSLVSVQERLQGACQSSSSSLWGQAAVSQWREVAVGKAGLAVSEKLKGRWTIGKHIPFRSVFQREMVSLISCHVLQVGEKYQTCLFFSFFKYLYFL